MATINYSGPLSPLLTPLGISVDIVPALKYITSLPDSNLPVACPAFTDYYYNTFAIIAPFDILFKIEDSTVYLFFNTTDVASKLLEMRCDVEDVKKIFSIGMHFQFTTDDDVMIEQIPANFTTPSNGYLIPGTFNISKWYRSIEFAYEMVDSSKPFTVKKGDPLCFVRFLPADRSKVKLERSPMTYELKQAVNECINSKEMERGKPLAYRYVTAEGIIKDYKKMRGNKCPMNIVRKLTYLFKKKS